MSCLSSVDQIKRPRGKRKEGGGNLTFHVVLHGRGAVRWVSSISCPSLFSTENSKQNDPNDKGGRQPAKTHWPATPPHGSLYYEFPIQTRKIHGALFISATCGLSFPSSFPVNPIQATPPPACISILSRLPVLPASASIGFGTNPCHMRARRLHSPNNRNKTILTYQSPVDESWGFVLHGNIKLIKHCGQRHAVHM